MTRDDILRMAREAGMTGLSLIDVGYLERFAALVAAEVGIAQWHRGFAEGQAAEREACAKVCNDKSMRIEQEAQRAIENGKYDEVSAIRSTAWQVRLCAHEICARSNNDSAAGNY